MALGARLFLLLAVSPVPCLPSLRLFSQAGLENCSSALLCLTPPRYGHRAPWAGSFTKKERLVAMLWEAGKSTVKVTTGVVSGDAP